MVQIHSCTQNGARLAQLRRLSGSRKSHFFILAVTVFYIFLCLSTSVKFVSVSGGVCSGADPKSGSARMRLWVGFYGCHHSNEKSGI